MTTMATPAAPALLPAAPLGHHPAPSSVSPATNSPPPAATSAASSPAPPVAHPALLHQFRAELLLPNGTPLKTGGAPVSSSAKPVYATPSPVESTPQNNECKLVEVKGAKLASFTVKDTELICLPQAFDVFLKHLVGGLHTVYTKLKRLDIAPVVCNVEQVRVLRGLGAIQPGVNRCKLISRQDFETLYNDCTNASSRPGRPPKRLQSVTEGGTHHMLSHSGLMHAGIMPPAGDHPGLTTYIQYIHLSALAKKIKLEAMASYHSNQQHGGPNGENGDHNPGLVLDQLPFMMMSHPLIPASLAPASVSMAMGQMNRLSTLASMANVAHLHAKPPARAPTSVIKERVRDSPSPSPSLEEAQMSSNHSSSVSSSPSHTERTAETTHPLDNGLSSSHSVLGHSPVVMQGARDTDVTSVEYSKENKRGHTDRDNSSLATHTSRESCDRQVYQKPPSGREGCERVSYPAGQKLSAGLHHTPFIFPEGLSSIETLLTNIQGLLRVAIENARAQEKQDQLERTELKMELVRERELRETLERQLSMEQKNRVLIQKRLKKEKRNKRRLQEALEEEVKLRDQAELSLLHTASTHTGHQSSAAPPHSESVTQDVDGSNHDDNRLDTKATIQEGRVFLQTTGMY
ncbi:dachshund c isoform X2 [Micropterus salmoides]|uniref:dachshund c isoform X2 n=1 Tax=Micropterus salmoides TaxID=27706 RepID=UPI0018EE34E8|nr:dachshund c isoform X2 [Micropterus salmoides]XP_045927267.1 dachshund c isoform X2 [Micropterus dolomieu]